MKKPYRWFVECDAHTNARISKDFLASEHAQQDMLCKDGELRNLWDLPYKYIREKLAVNRSTCHFIFTVFRSQGNGLPDLAPTWLYDKDAKRPPKHKRKDKSQLDLPYGGLETEHVRGNVVA